MAKGSYYRKHKEKIFGDQPVPERNAPVQITEALRSTYEDGKVILVDKPVHWTSFDVVRKIRNSLRIKKVGHAGTLDPLATGLLIVCTGKFTKKINEYMAREKEYTGTIILGSVTPTYDLESLPEQEKEVPLFSREDLETQAKLFTGEIHQFPPVYSAIKKNGTASYELARRGEAVELQARQVTVYRFEITGIALPEVQFRIVCSTGTYIRSIAHDFGAALGCGGHLGSLRRTRIGEFEVSAGLGMEEFLAELSAAQD